MDNKDKTYPLRVNSLQHRKMVKLSGSLQEELGETITVSQLYRVASEIITENPELAKQRIEQKILAAS